MIVSLSETDPLYKITVLPASAVPVIVGVVSPVVVDVVVSDGASGAVVSIVIDNSEEEDTLLALSVAVAVRE